MNSCSIKLKKDKLSKIINKLDFFVFRAMEQKGISFYKISQNAKTAESEEILDKVRREEYTKEQLQDIVGRKNAQVLLTASKVSDEVKIGNEVYKIAQMVSVLETVKNSIIPSYINDYTENAKINEEKGDKEEAENWKLFAGNLQSILTFWDQAVPNFFVFSNTFSLANKFKFDEDGLIDINDVADDEQKMLNKMVFDKPSNEINPLDDISKAVELFIKSIPSSKIDNFGFTSLIDYPSFMRQLYSDVENSLGMNELLEKLYKNKENVPEYKVLLEKLIPSQALTAEEFKFRLDFRNSFVKAFMPILITSIEEGTRPFPGAAKKHAFKITEAASGKVTRYENNIQTKFTVYGMPVVMPDGREVNLAHLLDGAWVLNKEDIPKITEYLKNDSIETKVNFLKAVGFDFSPKTEQMLLTTDYLTNSKKSRFLFLQNHLIKALTYSKKEFTLSPYKTLVNDAGYDDKNKKIEGQQAILAALIVEELKNNPEYNIEKSVITAEGTQMHSIQLHNNFTVLNKYLSDPEAFLTLQDIIDNEPSMFWLDPRFNPSIKRSLLLNSIFYFDPSNKETFGKRRRVTEDGNYSITKGEYVKTTILNTGGVQLKLDGEFKKESSSSTGLNEIDKLLQDIHGFLTTKNSNTSILRLGDKGTDLGLGINYILDVTSGRPIKNGKPLGNIDPNIDVIRTSVFMENISNALLDVAEMKYLGKKGFYDTTNEEGEFGDEFHNGLSKASKNIKNTWSYFDGILTKPTKDLLDAFIASRAESEDGNVNDVLQGVKRYKTEIEKDVQDYFDKTVDSFVKKFDDVIKLGITSSELLGAEKGQGRTNFPAYARFYLANTFITDLEQMKIFFGDAIYFKDFHKRASKDSATGVFTFVDKAILEHLNDFNNAQGLGHNTNLSARKLIERLYEQKKITKDQRDFAMSRQRLTASFKSAVFQDVVINSQEGPKIKENYKKLLDAGFVSPEMQDLFNASLSTAIQNGYKGAKEADGQGKCTFDFYRTMSILTSQWSDAQEVTYQKIVEYNHYDELADEETDEAKKSEYLRLRDAVGYDPAEAVYFPPKKFQYSGPMKYSKMIDDQMFSVAPPIFDKFSLQPLIPTVIKKGSLKTTDWHLARKMEFNGVSYIKFESATKVETPDVKDTVYTGYDENKPDERQVKAFDPNVGFISEQQLFFNHLKEQVLIDAEIHDSTIFGSQIRKLILMNLERPEFKGIKANYAKYLGELAELEKTSLYNDMGITKEKGKLKVKDLNRIIDYFFKEIAKKDQDSNVKKALNYDEATGEFEIPLDAAVQAQVLEGIIISAINNRVVRYKTNGSMLIQMAQTGSEAVKFNKDASAKALETYGDDKLGYYDVVIGADGKPTVTKMEVKIALTGQWLRLLELNDVNGVKIGSLERLNEMLLDENWVKENEKAITMISYRIPTQGRNFLDVMKIKEFMPASVGDAIIMPRECIIKSGSDYDIDKMFTFYPNLDKKGKYVSFNYDKSMLNENLESKKDSIVADLNYLKLARRTTVNDLNFEFKELQLVYKGALRKDTNAREKLNRLLRRVETIIAVMDAESESNIKTGLSKFADRNSMDDSELSKLIKSNASYNVAEHEQWMKDNNQNIFNPMLWIDTKKQGLETLKDSIENLFNSDVAFLKLTRDQNKEYIDDLNDTLQAEINHVYDKLYSYNHIKENIQNKLYETMSEVILHPSNYIELVTPSENYHIMPIINAIYKKLNPGSKERKTTDYKNTEILEREKNIQKFISLLKGKGDLGIAAVANTFNVMYQLANAGANPDFFLKNTTIKTFFDSINVEKSNGTIVGIDFSTIFDEDGVLKSEFFAEFITAFVDVAKDDYVFAANIVTELSPIMFYMKYTGMSSKKILNFANQPAIRKYTKNLEKYQNMFVKLNGVMVGKDNEKISARAKALDETLRELGYFEIEKFNKDGKKIKRDKRGKIEDFIIEYQRVLGADGLSKFYTGDALENQILPNGTEISKLSPKDRLVQISMLLELENLREQSNSVTEAQKFLNFDTCPFASTFDVVSRNDAYDSAIKGNSIFSKETLQYIKKESLISPLDVSNDITDILEQLFPVRNDRAFNKFLISKTKEARSNINNKAINSQDDEMKMARTAKNDLITFILQNFIGRSEEGMKFFHEMFGTDKNFNDYMLDLVKTNKLSDMYREIKDMTITTKDDDKETVENVFDILAERFPMVRNIQLQRGEYNYRISTWKIADKGSNVIEKESSIAQFEELCNLPNEEDKPIRDFFRNLALYSTFQSGLNVSDNSFTSMTPVNLINKLYGYAVSDFSKMVPANKKKSYDKFYELFVSNNPSFYSLDSKETPTQEISSRGKWYAVNTELVWEAKKETPTPQQIIPVVKNVIVNPVGGIKVISQDDVAAYHTYLEKSNGVVPVRFYTNKTTFKEFYNTNTGRREKAPQSSEWKLQPNGLYNLVDEDGGEIYIEDVDLRTGIKMVAPAQTSTIETARTVYDKLGTKTQSENVVLPKDLEDNKTYTTGQNFWNKIVPEARSAYDNKPDRKTGIVKPMLIAYRGNGKKTFLQNYKDGNTIGNPFDWQVETGTRDEQGIKSTKKFIHWMMTGNNMGVAEATLEYRQAIINDIKSGKIKKSPILYYQEKGYATHATALDYLINKYDWNNIIPETKVKILKNEEGLIIAENVISKADTIKMAQQSKQVIEETSFKQTAGSVSWGYGKQWMRLNAMSEKQREGLVIGKQLNGVEITQKMKDDFIKTGNSKGFPLYGYTTIDKNGNNLPSIPKEIINYLSSIGINISQYDASYNSVYDKSDNGSLIIHQDNSENNKSPIITMSLGRPMKFITYELKDSNDFTVADSNNTAFRIAVNAVQGEALKLNLIPASAKDAKGNIKYGHLTPDTLLKYAEEIDKKQGTQIKQFVIDKLREQFKNAEKTEYTLNNGAVLVFSGNNRNVLHEIVFDPETNAKPMESGFPTLKINKAFKGLGQKDNIVSTNDYRIVFTLRKVEGETLTNVINQEKLVGKPTEQKKMPKKPFERTFTPPTRDAQGNVIFPEVKSEETIGPGKYVKFNGETYIVTKVNANSTIQVYNPLKEGTAAKKSVAKKNLELLKHSANIVTYKDTDYIVTAKGIIISLATNKVQKWGEENGNRKAILGLANKVEETTSEYAAGSVESSISDWMNENPTHPFTDSIQTLAGRYNKEKLSTETIEEFLNRLSC